MNFVEIDRGATPMLPYPYGVPMEGCEVEREVVEAEELSRVGGRGIVEFGIVLRGGGRAVGRGVLDGSRGASKRHF